MAEVKKEAEEIRHEFEEKSFALELLTEFKAINKRLHGTVVGLLIALVVCNLAWIWLWQQYDYTSTSTYEAAGIYALIDSQGNVIAQDVSPETWEKFIEWWRIYGKSEGNENEDAN